MTMVRCLFCSQDFHIGEAWAMTFEEYSLSKGSLPEVGICEDCWNEAIVDKIPPEQISKIDDEIAKEFEEELIHEIEGRTGRKVFMESELSETEAAAIKLKDEGLILKRWDR